MKRWTQIFKALSNSNRLNIIKMLSNSMPLSVSDITKRLNISLKATSKNLIILSNLDILESKGRDGHIWYSLDQNMPIDIIKAIKLFT